MKISLSFICWKRTFSMTGITKNWTQFVIVQVWAMDVIVVHSVILPTISICWVIAFYCCKYPNQFDQTGHLENSDLIHAVYWQKGWSFIFSKAHYLLPFFIHQFLDQITYFCVSWIRCNCSRLHRKLRIVLCPFLSFFSFCFTSVAGRMTVFSCYERQVLVYRYLRGQTFLIFDISFQLLEFNLRRST